MTRARRSSILAIAASGLLLLAACGDDDDGGAATTTTASGGGATTTEAGGTATTGGGGEAAFQVNTDDCPDDSVNEPIEGTIKIGTTMPLSGGAAAAAFAPVAEGLQDYIDYANEQGLLPDHEIQLFIEDDQFNSNLTTPAIEGLLDNEQVNLFTSMIGTANNQVVRDLLNEECYPQLFAATGSPIWGDVENFPWTTGGLPPYNTETAIYVDNIKADFPDGASAGLFTVNSEFGDAYKDAFTELAPDANIDIVEEQ
jgi:ABC-type branched-subunit amino acid transport system substrate-binding protein